MPDTHDERGGDETAAEVVGLLRSLPRTKITPETVTQHMIDRWYSEKGNYLEQISDLCNQIRDLAEQLAAATARAEKAEARLAERRPIRAEWSTENTYSHPSDDVISQELAARRVIAHPGIHTAVLRRQLYAGPWAPAAEACRSCGETERVLGDPPLCSNCAVYGAGWSSQRPDASLDGLRGPFTGLIGPLGIEADENPPPCRGCGETYCDDSRKDKP